MRARAGWDIDLVDCEAIGRIEGAGSQAPYVAVVDGEGRVHEADQEARFLLEAGERSRPGPRLGGQAPRATRLLSAPGPWPALRIVALGCTELPGQDGAAQWLGQRTGQLLKFLAVRRFEIVSSDAIALTVWGYEGFAGSGAVRRCVCDLRSKLVDVSGAGLLARQGGYGLDPDGVSVDVDDFRAHISRARRALSLGQADLATAHLRLATAMYRGDFLADEPDAVWAAGERERLREEVELAYDQMAAGCWARGDHRAATDSVRRLAELAPYDSAVHRRLVGLLLAQGRLSAARRCYVSFERRLARDLSLRPDFELADLLHVSRSPDVRRGPVHGAPRQSRR